MLRVMVIAIIAFSLVMPSVFAQESQKIVLLADKSAYVEGEIITISGRVTQVITGTPVSLQIFSEKNQIGISQVDVTQEGQFTDKIITGGPLWKNEGQILIKATYGEISSDISVDYFKNTPGEYSEIFEVTVPDAGTFDVFYTIKGGNVNSISLNQKNLSLAIDIDTVSDGVLDIKLFRDNIDSLSNSGEDIDFIVLIYEKDNSAIPVQTDFKKIDKTDDYREISIPIKKDDIQVEIIGTQIIPEFGTITMIVLAVAIVSIIAVSAKSRLSIMPRI